MTTHFQVETSDLLRRACPLLPETASHLGDMQVRNKGTIGGSLVHSDPAADWPAAILAVDGVAVNLTLDGGKCQSAAVGITGVSPKAYRAVKVESTLKGNALDAKTLGAAAAHAADGVDVNADLYASADYRKQLAAVYTRRALETAVSRIGK